MSHVMRKTTVGGELAELTYSWARSLRVRNLSPRTIAIYTGATDQLKTWLVGREFPTEVDEFTRDDLRAYKAPALVN